MAAARAEQQRKGGQGFCGEGVHCGAGLEEWVKLLGYTIWVPSPGTNAPSWTSL